MRKDARHVAAIYLKKPRQWVKLSRRALVAPERLCLYENRDESVSFFNSILATQERGFRPLLIDLSRVQMTGAAALSLFAHVSWLKLAAGSGDLIEIRPPQGDAEKLRFYGSGLSKALKFEGGRLDSLLDVGANFSTSVKPNEHYNRTCQEIARRYSVPEGLLGAIQESLLNVTEHAYDARLADGELRGRWWQYFYKDGAYLYFSVYDLGRGIPSLMRSAADGWKSDRDLVLDAMTAGVSSTKVAGRGRGSEDMKKPIQLAASGGPVPRADHLLVMSGAALYHYHSGPGGTNCVSTKSALSGTLIEWRLPIGPATVRAG